MGTETDHHPVTRRTRKLQLDELVAGALILYPTYVSRVTGCFTTPERAVEELVEWRQRGTDSHCGGGHCARCGCWETCGESGCLDMTGMPWDHGDE